MKPTKTYVKLMSLLVCEIFSDFIPNKPLLLTSVDFAASQKDTIQNMKTCNRLLGSTNQVLIKIFKKKICSLECDFLNKSTQD